MKYQPRVLEAALKSYLTSFPAVGLTGPRQSGKSTLIKKVLVDYRYVSFDDYRVRDFFENDPQGFIQTYNDKVIFDEAQKAPEIFNLVKIAIDNDRQRYGKFVLTGSSQFSLMKNITESLAGRIGLLTLLPYQYVEMPEQVNRDIIIHGSYPEVVHLNNEQIQNWYASYIETYLNKDLRAIKDIGNLRDFSRFMQLLASNVSQALNMSNYANDLGVSVPTIKSWLSVLEASYIIFLLPPFYKNYGKRITKSPKLYFYDTGLVSYLTAINTIEQYKHGPMKGAIFENYLVTEIIKKEKHNNTHADFYYYRTSSGMEIDLIIDRKQYKELIEIKSGAGFTTRMIQPVEALLSNSDLGYLLYNGEQFPYKEPIQVINYRDYLQQ